MTQIPIARGLAVCENVIVEERTHNLTLVNCFTMKRAAAFPANIRFVALAFLSDGDGEVELTISVQRLDTLDIVYTSSHSVRSANRMQEVRFFLRIENCPFPVPGNYQVNLLANGELLAQQRFLIAAYEEIP
jgi:hypothetical protein